MFMLWNSIYILNYNISTNSIIRALGMKTDSSLH